MKRCPKCNRAFTRETQKFCTHDGTALLDGAALPTAAAPPATAAPASPAAPEIDLKETIQFDSARLHLDDVDDDFETKVISRDAFDPYKTNVSTPENTVAVGPVDTSDLRAPAPLPPTADLNPSLSPPPVSSAPQPAAPAEPPPPVPPRSRISIPATATAAEAVQPAVAPPAVAAPRPGKRSTWPIVLGILFVLLIMAIGAAGAGYWFVVRPMLEKKRAVFDEPVRAPPRTTTANTDTGPKKSEAKEAPPYRPPLGAVQFVNSIDNLDGKLKEHYVDFSFYYPEGWQKDPKAGVAGASNFAKVERRLPPDFTQENFAVGWYASAGSAEADQSLFPTLAGNLSAQFAKNFAEYKKVSEGPTKVGIYDGYQFRFESASRDTAKGDLQIWGRVIFLPPVDGGKNGVTLLMLTTSLALELKSVNDVGVKGELPMMLESFRFGK